MPVKSERQRRAMQAAAHGHSTLSIPRKVAMNYLTHSPSSYDDSTPVNGKPAVRHAASQELPESSAKGGTDAGGTDALGDAPQTKQAGHHSTPSRSDKVPAGVDHYSDSGV